MQNAIDFIEEHLTEQIDFSEIAAQSFSSSHHFQRVFSILCGFTVGEYIRNRRLSLAGSELSQNGTKVIDIALKYGYESPDSFAKAFQKFHGILPSQAKNEGANLKSFSRLVLKFSFEGGQLMNYTIKTYPETIITGHSRVFKGSPTERLKQQHDFLVDGNVRFIRYALQGMACDCNTEYCVISNVTDNSFRFTIGTQIPEYFNKNLKKTIGTHSDELDIIKIPKQTYVHAQTVKGCTFWNNQDLLYRQIVKEWLPTSGYILANSPEITIVHKFNDDKNNSYAEILLPIEKV